MPPVRQVLQWACLPRNPALSATSSPPSLLSCNRISWKRGAHDCHQIRQQILSAGEQSLPTYTFSAYLVSANIQLDVGRDPAKAVKSLVASGMAGSSPEAVAAWIREHLAALDPTQIGEFLGNHEDLPVRPCLLSRCVRCISVTRICWYPHAGCLAVIGVSQSFTPYSQHTECASAGASLGHVCLPVKTAP